MRMYSMEPPFYNDLDKATRTCNRDKLKTLGPFAKAIEWVLACGDSSDIKRDDALEQGW